MKRSLAIMFIVIGVLVMTVSGVSAAVLNYRSHLSGSYNIPFVVDTNATGQAVFQMKDDGMGLSYKVIVANVENVTMAHIHRLPASGTGNGPIIAWLYPSAPPLKLIQGRSDGILAEGVLYDANIRHDYNGDGVLNLDDLMSAIEAGDTYVNVHTLQVPAGEIHGPIH